MSEFVFGQIIGHLGQSSQSLTSVYQEGLLQTGLPCTVLLKFVLKMATVWAVYISCINRCSEIFIRTLSSQNKITNLEKLV